MSPEELETERKICKLRQAIGKHRGDCLACAYDAAMRGPPCGHSACSQNYIDTGDRECVEDPCACSAGIYVDEMTNAVRACDTCNLFASDSDAAAVVEALLERLRAVYREKQAKDSGATVADALALMDRRAGGFADDETPLDSAAPRLLAVLERVAAFWAGGDVPAELDAEMRAAIAAAKGEP